MRIELTISNPVGESRLIAINIPGIEADLELVQVPASTKLRVPLLVTDVEIQIVPDRDEEEVSE